MTRCPTIWACLRNWVESKTFQRFHASLKKGVRSAATTMNRGRKRGRSTDSAFVEEVLDTATSMATTLTVKDEQCRRIKIGRASCREKCVSTCRTRWSREP